MKQLIVFPTPLESLNEFRLDDSGQVIVGAPATHSTGRPGQGFTIPDNTPNGHGATWTCSAKGKVPVVLHGILWIKGNACTFEVDTVTLVDEKKGGRSGVVRLA